MNKVRKRLVSASILLFSTVLLVGGAFGISSALAYTAAAEEGKIISDNTVILASGIGKVANNVISGTPRYTIVDSDKAGAMYQPSAKDISKEKAVSYAADKITQMFDDKLDGSRAIVNFSKSYSKVILKDVWVVNFQTADQNKMYWSSIDSVTGEVYDITLFDKSKDPLNIGVEPENMTPEQKQALQEASDKQIAQSDAILRDNNRFIEAASDIVNANLLNGRTVVSSKFNSLGSVNGRLVLDVAVSMSDGSGYLIQLDGFTRELVGYSTRPDGVKEAR